MSYNQLMFLVLCAKKTVIGVGIVKAFNLKSKSLTRRDANIGIQYLKQMVHLAMIKCCAK